MEGPGAASEAQAGSSCNPWAAPGRAGSEPAAASAVRAEAFSASEGRLASARSARAAASAVLVPVPPSRRAAPPCTAAPAGKEPAASGLLLPPRSAAASPACLAAGPAEPPAAAAGTLCSFLARLAAVYTGSLRSKVLCTLRPAATSLQVSAARVLAGTIPSAVSVVELASERTACSACSLAPASPATSHAQGQEGRRGSIAPSGIQAHAKRHLCGRADQAATGLK